MKKCEQNVVDHEIFDKKNIEAINWMEAAKKRYNLHVDKASTRENLQQKQTVVQVSTPFTA